MTANSKTGEESARRFSFGRNWRDFLTLLDGERIAEAEKSLKEMLGLETLAGLSFLDIGSGSGLFSLAARRLGAKVVSFDYDPDSVTCTNSLKEKFFAGDKNWRVEQGSVLDAGYLSPLGRFDIVYSWGVLHHTGDMWHALGNAAACAKPGGLLFISIYNDEDWRSRRNRRVKKFYVGLPNNLKTVGRGHGCNEFVFRSGPTASAAAMTGT